MRHDEHFGRNGGKQTIYRPPELGRKERLHWCLLMMSRIGLAPDHAASNAGHRGTLLGMVRIGELENGDLFVPVPAEFDAEGHVVDGIMCRIAADTDEHAGWMREVEAGRVELVRRDPTRKFAWVDGPRS